jgi:hypothetical protein
MASCTRQGIGRLKTLYVSQFSVQITTRQVLPNVFSPDIIEAQPPRETSEASLRATRIREPFVLNLRNFPQKVMLANLLTGKRA